MTSPLLLALAASTLLAAAEAQLTKANSSAPTGAPLPPPGTNSLVLTRSRTWTVPATNTGYSEVDHIQSLRVQALKDQEHRLFIATVTLGVVMFVVVLPVFLFLLRRYNAHTRRLLQQAPPPEVYKPWVGLEMVPPTGTGTAFPSNKKVGTVAFAAAAVPLLAKPAAATTTATYYASTEFVHTTVTIDDQKFYDNWYKPQREYATQQIATLSILLPIIVIVPLFLMAGLSLVRAIRHADLCRSSSRADTAQHAYLRRRRAKRTTGRKVEYWGVN
ncbi:uncharacterized protein LOC62_05G007254 [Vanrija pseudolonga]|uniref:Uncharacterized protein n=1 Tax=Vanrija pseudolonga TaxID=143232 RepID=A0AAF0YBI0_9TREE|nr:hypothetical protein LOC62_05G007254 [Vanrija pseudolonga]